MKFKGNFKKGDKVVHVTGEWKDNTNTGKGRIVIRNRIGTIYTSTPKTLAIRYDDNRFIGRSNPDILMKDDYPQAVVLANDEEELLDVTTKIVDLIRQEMIGVYTRMSKADKMYNVGDKGDEQSMNANIDMVKNAPVVFI